MAKRLKEHQFDEARKERKGKVVKKFKEKQQKNKKHEKPQINREAKDFLDEMLTISETED